MQIFLRFHPSFSALERIYSTLCLARYYTCTLCLKNGPTLKPFSSKWYGYILMKFGRNIQKAVEYSLHVSVFMYVCLLSRYRLSNGILKITPACCVLRSASCWARLFLQHLRRRTLWIICETDDQWISRLTWNFSWLWGLSSWLNCVDVFISMRTASPAAQTPVDCSVHQQPTDAVLRPTFVYKLCYKLPSVVTFTFLQTSD